jgi:hypothetical protein
MENNLKLKLAAQTLKSRATSKRGSVLFIVLVIMSFMIILASAVYYTVMNNRQGVIMTYSDNQAFQTANDILNAFDFFVWHETMPTEGTTPGTISETDALFSAIFGDMDPSVGGGFFVGCDRAREAFATRAPFPGFPVDGIATAGDGSFCGPTSTPPINSVTERCAMCIWKMTELPSSSVGLNHRGHPEHFRSTNNNNVRHYLVSEPVMIPGGGTATMIIFVNSHGDIVAEAIVELNGRRVSSQRVYDGGAQRRLEPSWGNRPEPGRALHWEWTVPHFDLAIGDATSVIGPAQAALEADGWELLYNGHFLWNRFVPPADSTAIGTNNVRVTVGETPNVPVMVRRIPGIGTCTTETCNVSVAHDACYLGDGWWLFIASRTNDNPTGNTSLNLPNGIAFRQVNGLGYVSFTFGEASVPYRVVHDGNPVRPNDWVGRRGDEGLLFENGGWNLPPSDEGGRTVTTREGFLCWNTACTLAGSGDVTVGGTAYPRRVPRNGAAGGRALLDTEAAARACCVWTPTSTGSGGTAPATRDPVTGAYNFSVPGVDFSWQQRAAFHSAGSGPDRLALRGAAAPIHFNTSGILHATSTRGPVTSDVSANTDLYLGDASIQNPPAFGRRLEVTVGNNMHIGSWPAIAGVSAGSTSNGRIWGSNIDVRVRNNLHIDVQNATSFGEGATYYVVGDVVYARNYRPQPQRVYVYGNVRQGNTIIPEAQWPSNFVRMTETQRTETLARINFLLGSVPTDANWPMPAQTRTLEIGWNSTARDADDWATANPSGTTGHELEQYGIFVDSTIRNRIFYINDNATVRVPSSPGSSQNAVNIVLIDTGLGANARTINLRLDGSNNGNVFNWSRGSGQTFRVAVMSIGDGTVVMEIPEGQRYGTEQGLYVGPFNLAVLRNTANADWISCTRLSRISRGEGRGVDITESNTANWSTNTGWTGIVPPGEDCTFANWLIGLSRNDGSGTLRSGASLVASGCIRARNHNPERPLNMNLILAYNGAVIADNIIDLTRASFFAGGVYMPRSRFAALASGDNSVVFFGSIFASEIRLNTQYFYISLLPGGGIATSGTQPPSPPSNVTDVIPGPATPDINIGDSSGAAQAGSGVAVRPVTGNSWGAR